MARLPGLVGALLAAACSDPPPTFEPPAPPDHQAIASLVDAGTYADLEAATARVAASPRDAAAWNALGGAYEVAAIHEEAERCYASAGATRSRRMPVTSTAPPSAPPCWARSTVRSSRWPASSSSREATARRGVAAASGCSSSVTRPAPVPPSSAPASSSRAAPTRSWGWPRWRSSTTTSRPRCATLKQRTRSSRPTATCASSWAMPCVARGRRTRPRRTSLPVRARARPTPTRGARPSRGLAAGTRTPCSARASSNGRADGPRPCASTRTSRSGAPTTRTSCSRRGSRSRPSSERPTPCVTSRRPPGASPVTTTSSWVRPTRCGAQGRTKRPCGW